MLNSGIHISSALMALAQAATPNKAIVFETLHDDIEKGKSLSQALASQPDSFPNSFCTLIRIAERTGTLVKSLDRFLELQEKRLAVGSRLKKALIYPAVLVASSFVMVLLILFLVFPMILAVLDKPNEELPALTKLVIEASSANSIASVLCALFLSGLFLKIALSKSASANILKEFWELRTPLGRFTTQTHVARSLGQLSVLIESGCDILTALNLASEVGERSFLLRRAYADSIKRLTQGENLRTAFAAHPVFPKIVPAFISVGEQAGGLGSLIRSVSIILEEELDHQVDILSAWVEPVVMGIMGSLIGVILLAALLPIYDLVSV